MDVEARMSRLKLRQLRQLGRTWFMGSLGGESTKAGITREMVSQMRYWWRALGDNGGKERVARVMADLALAEEEA